VKDVGNRRLPLSGPQIRSKTLVAVAAAASDRRPVIDSRTMGGPFSAFRAPSAGTFDQGLLRCVKLHADVTHSASHERHHPLIDLTTRRTSLPVTVLSRRE
jgi:hypothetical protein